MTELHDHDEETETRPNKRKRALFLGFLLLASTLIYLELILRYSH